MNPTPSQLERPEHNPDNLTPEQYGAPEWRLLSDKEEPSRGDEVWSVYRAKWIRLIVDSPAFNPGKRDSLTYRRRVVTRTAILGNQTEVDRLTARIAELEKERDAVNTWSEDVRDRNIELATHNLDLKEALAEARKDSARIDWLERQAKESRTGISFDWCRYAEEGQVLEHGFRFMRYHHLGDRKKSLREAIDAATPHPETI